MKKTQSFANVNAMLKSSGLWGLVFAAWLVISPLSGTLFGQVLYVANYNSRTVAGYAVGGTTTGALTAMPGSPFSAGLNPTQVAVHPTSKFIYVTNAGSNNISGYTVDQAGALTAMAGSPFSAGSNPVAIAVDPTGRFAYAADFSSNDVSAYTIDAVAGALTLVSGSPFPAGTEPISASIDPTGKFLYVANTTSASISGYLIDSTSGVLTPIAGSPFPAGVGPRSAIVSPNGKFVLEANFNDANVGVYAINGQTGALTPVAGSPFPAGQWPFSIAVDRTGRFVYVDNNGLGGPGSISAYTMNASTGSLSPVVGSPFATGSTSAPTPGSAMTIDPGGEFLYATSTVDNDIWVYAIDGGTGAITPISGSPFAAASSPEGPVVVNLDTDVGFAHLLGGNTFSGNQTVLGSVTATAFSGDGSGLTGVNAAAAATASGLNCAGCVGNTQLGISYAAGDVQGGNALNALALGGNPASFFAPFSGDPNYAPSSGSGSYVAKAGDAMTGALTLPANGLVAGTSQLVLSGGAVGIGTSSPSNTLAVSQSKTWTSINDDIAHFVNTTGDSNVSVQSVDGTWDAAFQMLRGTNRKWILDSCGTNGCGFNAFSIIEDGNIYRLTIQEETGHVGIGTTAPAQALDVVGKMQLEGSGNGIIFPDGSVQVAAAAGGTITGVTAGSGLSGGGTSGSVTLTNTGILSITAGSGISSTGGQTPTLSLNTSVTDARYLQLIGGTLTGALAAPSFAGNGSGLTSLNPGNLSAGTAGINISGTAASAVNATNAGNALNLGGVAAGNYARLDIANAFNGNQSVTGNVSASGNLSSAGTTTIGGGTPIVEHLSTTFNPAFPALKPSTCASLALNLTGASDGDTLALGVPNARLTGGGTLNYFAWVSAANTISIRACNIDPNIKQTTAGTGAIRVDVWKH